FIGAVRDARGWEGVNRVFRVPPQSSEQILHPQKYLDGNDAPLVVQARAPAAALARGYAEVARDTLGEEGIRNLIHQHSGDPVRAARASAGWGGDQCIVLRDGKGELLLVWRTVWDSEKDAEEFQAGWKRVALKQIGRSDPNEGQLSPVRVLDAKSGLPSGAV